MFPVDPSNPLLRVVILGLVLASVLGLVLGLASARRGVRGARSLVIALAVLVLGGGLLLLERGLAGARLQLAVVRTVDDLLRRPAIELGDGRRVRLGIEAREAGGEGAVLLYCLGEGPRPAFEDAHARVDRLGPLALEFRSDGFEQRFAVDVQQKLRRLERASRRWLYVKPIYLRGADRLEVEILDPATTRLVGRTRLRRASRASSPWLELHLIAPHEEPLGRGARYRMDLPANGPVVPRFASDGLYRPGRELTAADRLPALGGDAGVPGLELRVEAGRSLRLRWRPELELAVHDPGVQFIARWWLNGQAFRPTGPSISTGLGMLEMAPESSELSLDLEAGDRLRAGDRLEVEVLYTARGSASPDGERLHFLVECDGLFRSDRVEWIWPGEAQPGEGEEP